MSWEHRDRHAVWLGVALFGSLAAIALGLFGLPRFYPHTPWYYLGVMDPLCGMTRAVRAMALGQLSAAWTYNPGSFALALGALGIFVRYAFGTVTGRWLAISVRNRRLLYVVGLLLIAALWVNQQSHADLLRM